MSKIQINLELESNKPNELKIVAKMLLELAGAPTISEQAASDQQWAEEVKESQNEEAAPKKRASRAKPKTEQDVEASEAEESKAEESKAEESKAEESKAEESKAEESKAEEPKAEAASEEGIKLDDLRASLSLKVKSYREEIKAKLTELGASNLTTLDAGKYADMNDFLKGLK